MGKNVCQFKNIWLKHVLLGLFSFFCVTAIYAQGSGPLEVTANISESDCRGVGHVVSVKARGGEAPYTYRWNDGAEGAFRKDLESGTYSCTVRDSGGNEKTESFFFAPQAPAIEVSYDQEMAADGTYSLKVNAKGGVAPYSYFWFGQGIDVKANQQKEELKGLQKGILQLVVQDAHQCTANVTVNLK